MPTTAFAPSISQVYEAFDAAAHRLFRVAMALSRRGVVRVDDLLAALHLANVSGAAAAVRLLPAPPPPPRDLLPCTPMANEPALRSLLTEAWRLAEQQQPPSAITPAILWAALLLQHCVRLRANPRGALADLGVVPPPDLPAVTCRPPAIAAPQAALWVAIAAPRSPNITAENLRWPGPQRIEHLETVLAAWVALQDEPAGVERECALQSVIAQARNLERLDSFAIHT